MNRSKGIIFDMDNTLLQSRIDFDGMKKDTFRFLVDQKVLPENFDLSGHTTSTLIQAAEESGRLSDRHSLQMWDIVKGYEVRGMEGAQLEPGVNDMLDQLQNEFILTVLTNNSIEAAENALRNNQIRDFFDLVIGRETTQTLKPSSAGIEFIINEYPEVDINHWLSIGDAWIDGFASVKAGVRFISYQTDVHTMHEYGVYPEIQINSFDEFISWLKG